MRGEKYNFKTNKGKEHVDIFTKMKTLSTLLYGSES